MSKNSRAGLYVHVPFCKTKCPYCDFFSLTDLSETARWLRAIDAEAALCDDGFPVFDTLFVGGGTPSCLTDRELDILFGHLRRRFAFSGAAEITVEVNPDDVTDTILKTFVSLGVNRISMGIQSFDDNELRFLGRRHNSLQARKAIGMATSAGISNMSIDLIYGLPGQSIQSWCYSLETALDCEPTHISCYELTFEGRTPFARQASRGRMAPVDEETARRFFLTTTRFLTQRGYIHYEVSNFARDRDSRCRHNLTYWEHHPYLGLGPSAHSFLYGSRWWNVTSFDEYCHQAMNGIKPRGGREYLSEDQLRLERLFLGLRTKKGVSLEEVSASAMKRETIERLVQSGHLRIREDRVVPTVRGLLIADKLPLII